MCLFKKKKQIKNIEPFFNGELFYPLMIDVPVWLHEAIFSAEKTLNDKTFGEKLIEIDGFSDTNDNGEQVYKKLTAHKTAYIDFYKTKYPFSKVLAYVSAGHNLINLNLRNYPMAHLGRYDFKRMARNLIHERLHVVGYYHNNDNSQSVYKKVDKIIEELSI